MSDRHQGHTNGAVLAEPALAPERETQARALPAGGNAATPAAADLPALADLTRGLLAAIGEDPAREGLRATPERVARSLAFLTQGYRLTPEAAVANALFTEDYDELVLVRDIEFYSLCEHHLLPFFGKVHIGYVPNGRIVGLSKLPRLVEVFARRLQVQERLTREIAESIERLISPLGVGVIVEASHLCMQMRGVQKQQSTTTTSCLRGVFQEDGRTRAEFLALIGRQPAGRAGS